ncbi:MAG: TonB-dependent receptor [Cytophagales bacterium]|nr:TonB-dependent receptor [Cytophagales bacterium]
MRKFIVTLATFVAGYSHAQDSLRIINLEEVAIQAVRASEDEPVPQTNISLKQILSNYTGQHPIFMMDKLIPGFYSYSESGSSFANYGQFRMRGINQERINITLNGVPLNDMIDQGVFFSNFTDITSGFESIQVQRGVGTSSNGVSSYGGSINFESRNLIGKEANSSIEIGAGSYGTYRANVQHFTGISKKGFGLMSSFSKLTSDGYKDHTSTDASSFFLTGGYFGERDIMKITLFTARSENGLGYYTIDKSILDDDPTYNNLTANDKDDFSQHMAQLQYNRKLNDHWNVGLTGYYGAAGGDYAEGTPDVDSVYVENYFWQYPSTFFSINYPLQNDHFGGILNAAFSQGKIDFSTGLHVYTFRRENLESILPDDANPYYLEKSQKDEASWFGKVSYRFGQLKTYADIQIRSASLTISPDYDWIGILSEGDIKYDWTFFNPKLGIAYDISNQFSLYSSYGRSGREPAKIDLLGGFQLNAFNYPGVRSGSDFTEEHVNDLEIGARLNWNKLMIDGNVYFMSFENEIAPIGDVIAFGLQERRNIPESRRSGLELMWAWLLDEKVEFSGNLAYLKAEISQVNIGGTDLAEVQHILSPKWIISPSMKLNWSDKLASSLSGKYISGQFMELSNDRDFKVPSSLVLDFSVDLKIKDQIRLRAFVNNLLDKQYFTYGTVSDVDFSGTLEPGYFAQPGRNYFFSASFNF